MAFPPLIWSSLTVGVTAVLLAVYPHHGLLLAALAGTALAGMLLCAASSMEPRRFAVVAVAAVSLGPAAWLLAPANPSGREATELSLAAVFLVGAFGMYNRVDATPRRTGTPSPRTGGTANAR